MITCFSYVNEIHVRCHHKVEKCTNIACNNNNSCKRVHLTDDEIIENIYPFQETIYQEMKRLAYILRNTFLENLTDPTCTLNMLGKCLWPCLACQTYVRNHKYLHNICLFLAYI